MLAYEILNKMKWSGDLKDCKIIIRHRGAENDMKIIPGEAITEIKKSHFYYKDNEKEFFIPIHRVLEIRMKGEAIWQKRKKEM